MIHLVPNIFFSSYAKCIQCVRVNRCNMHTVHKINLEILYSKFKQILQRFINRIQFSLFFFFYFQNSKSWFCMFCVIIRWRAVLFFFSRAKAKSQIIMIVMYVIELIFILFIFCFSFSNCCQWLMAPIFIERRYNEKSSLWC